MASWSFPLLDRGSPRFGLSLPTDGSGDRAAHLISAAVRARFGIEPDAAGTSIVALGCLANNPLIESLYLRFRTIVDRWYPGAGGYAIQPVALAGSGEPRIIVIGASDADGLEAGARAFCSMLAAAGHAHPGLPWKLAVKLGAGHLPLPEDRIDLLGTSSSDVPAPHSEIPSAPYLPAFRGGSARDHLLRLGMYGPHADNDHFSRSSQLGLRYLYSGDLEDARRYRAGLLEEIETGVLARLYHYKSIRMFQLWELLQHCEVFSTDDRRRVDRAILEYLVCSSGIASLPLIRSQTTGRGILNRHTACDALNLWLGADYFHRKTGCASWLPLREEADAYFRSQAGTDVPLTGLTEGYATYLEVYLDWMLLSCPQAIRRDPHVRLWADRVASLCTNRGTLLEGGQTDTFRYCYGLMRRLAYLLGDPGYLFVSDLRERAVHAGNDRAAQFGAGQAWAGDLEPTPPPLPSPLRVLPVNERHRLLVVPSLPRAAGFDRAVGRSGWDTEDDYLAVIGIIGPNKTLPNAGSVAGYDRLGARLLASPELSLCADENAASGYSICTVSVEGRDTDCRRAVQILHRSSAQGMEILAFRAVVPGLYAWYRVLCWAPGAFLLAADSIVLERGGAATAGVHWRCAGALTGTPEGSLMRTRGSGGPVTFRIDTQADAALPLRRWIDERPQAEVAQLARDTTPRLDILHTDAEVGPRLLPIVSLLHAVRDPEAARWSLEVSGDTATVRGDGRTIAFAGLAPAPDGSLRPTVRAEAAAGRARRPLRPQSRRPSSAPPLAQAWRRDIVPSCWSASPLCPFFALGTADGRCMLLDADGRPAAEGRADGAVTAVFPAEDGLLAGTSRGEVIRFDLEGRSLWRHRVPRRPERAFWWWWFTPEPMIGALCLAGDGRSRPSLVAAGTGSCSLNVLDARTGALLADELSPYGLADTIRAVPEEDGATAFHVGHSRFTCSSTVRAWRAPWKAERALRYDGARSGELRSPGWDMSGVRGFEVDAATVAVLRHGTFNQLSSYARGDGRHRWTVDLGGAPIALVAGCRGAGTLTVCSRDGWVTSYDEGGRQTEALRAHEELRGATRDAAGRLVTWGTRLALLGDLRSLPLHGVPVGWLRIEATEGLLWRDADGIALLRA